MMQAKYSARMSGFLLGLTLLATPALAQEHHEDTTAHSEHSGHSYHKDTYGIFVGFAAEDGSVRENGIAVGFEYEHRFNATFGLGAVVEHTWGDIDTWVYAMPFAYHNGPWKFYVAPGLEDGDHGTEDLLRLGAEYGFHYGKWEISPQIDLDIVDRSEVWVVGVVFARGF